MELCNKRYQKQRCKQINKEKCFYKINRVQIHSRAQQKRTRIAGETVTGIFSLDVEYQDGDSTELYYITGGSARGMCCGLGILGDTIVFVMRVMELKPSNIQ